jgi:exodeoxyribonuclease VII small subunit
MTSDSADQPAGYAEALAELDRLLVDLDDDEIDIDLLSTKVARAAVLIEFCRARIHNAQLEVSTIVTELDANEPGD